MDTAILTPSTSTTPDAAPASSPAAPATSAPTPETRPKTFADAFAKDIAPPVEGPAPTVPPAEAMVDPQKPPGPIPFDVHKKTLDNSYKERDTARTALETYKQQYGWAESIPRETIQEWTGIANRMATDPISFLSELQSQIAAHPVYGPQLKSHAARTLASGRSSAIEPSIPVVDAQGNVVDHAYSADQVKQLIQQSVASSLQQEVGPIKQDLQTRQERERSDQMNRQLDAQTETIYTKVKALPGFEAHAQEIATAFEAIDGEGEAALLWAYHQVVDPIREADIKAGHLKDLQTKAAASTVNPSRAPVSTAHRPTSFHDKDLQW